MSKFKVGDNFIVMVESHAHGFKKGDVIKLIDDNPELLACFVNNSGWKQLMKLSDLKFIDPDYQNSNRNKLREHIKSLGFSAIDLSVAAGFNKAYFGSETGQSRFNSRGDISDDRLLELKHKAFEAKKKLASKSIGKLTVDLEVKTTFIPNKDKELIKKPKSKWIVSNKVFFTFVFFFVLSILLALTGIVKQVF